MSAENKPELIYDGHCKFCRHWAARWRHLTGDRVKYVPAENAQDSVQWVAMNGKSYQGAEAVFHVLAYAPRFTVLLWLYQHIPLFAPVAEWAYRRVANNRARLSHLTRKIRS